MFPKSMRLLALILGFLAPALAHAAEPTRFTVEVRGSGPDVLQIPGLASSRAVWEPTAKALEGRYRLHVLQINGFAGAPAEPTPRDRSSMVSSRNWPPTSPTTSSTTRPSSAIRWAASPAWPWRGAIPRASAG